MPCVGRTNVTVPPDNFSGALPRADPAPWPPPTRGGGMERNAVKVRVHILYVSG
jgi:hypothetical protein